MENQPHFWAFCWEVFNNWAGYFTGGCIIAVVTFWHSWRDKTMKRKFLLGLTILFFAMGAYKAWEEQYNKAIGAGETSDVALGQARDLLKTIDADRVTIEGQSEIIGRLTADLWERTNDFETKTVQQQMNDVGWLPPELPPGCSNVSVSFGTTKMEMPLWLAKVPIGEDVPSTNVFISQIDSNLTIKFYHEGDGIEKTNTSGIVYPLVDLPFSFVSDAEKTPDFSPRKRQMTFNSRNWQIVLPNGKAINGLVFPIVTNNRLFVDVQIPFINERRRILMDTNGEEGLSKIPLKWDINYDTNKFEVVNEDTNPVLQVIYKSPSEVQVNGVYVIGKMEVYAAFNSNPVLLSWQMGEQPTQLMDIEDFERKFPNITVITDSNVLYRTKFSFAKVIFKYPSWEFLHQLAN